MRFFSSSYRIMFSARPLRSTGVTPLPRYYGPLRLPTGPPRRLCIPAERWPLSPPPRRASQAPRLIFPRALSPTTPEGPLAAFACCFTTGLSGFILVGGLATFVFLSRPNRVHLRYGSRVRLPSRSGPLLVPPLVRLHAEQAIYMVNSFQFTKSARLILVTDSHGAVSLLRVDFGSKTAP